MCFLQNPHVGSIGYCTLQFYLTPQSTYNTPTPTIMICILIGKRIVTIYYTTTTSRPTSIVDSEIAFI